MRKQKMNYALLLLLLSILSCGERGLLKDCPYEFSGSANHYLRVPTKIVPHKKVYHVGDTITIQQIFTDSIYDINTKEYFKIEGFPFRPSNALWHFINDTTALSGFRTNEYIVDSSYNIKYYTSNLFVDNFIAYSVYKNEMYSFDFKIVLNEKGRYLFRSLDKYNSYNDDYNKHLNAEADAITFEGKCEQFGYYICNMIEGDDHLSDYEKELLYLDNEIYLGNMTSIKANSIFSPGYYFWEFQSYFGFEVID